MREILFRGKLIHKEDYMLYEKLYKDNKDTIDVFNNGFVYGSLVVIKDKYYICVGIAGVSINSLINNTTATFVEVIPETISQYTGLKDKNGNKIFEGDIVERLWLGEKHIYRIYYDNDIASFIGKDIYGLNFTTFDCDACEFEVIGNIYDNPELLGGVEE